MVNFSKLSILNEETKKRKETSLSYLSQLGNKLFGRNSNNLIACKYFELIFSKHTIGMYWFLLILLLKGH